MAQELPAAQSSIDRSSLHTFAVGQVFASVAGGIGDVAFNFFFNSGIPLLPVLLLCAIASAGAVPAMLVTARTSNWRVTTATYVFVFSATVAIALSLLLFGVKTGVPAFFVWPVLTAAMLLGGISGSVVAALCVTTVAIFFALQSNATIVPVLDSNGSSFVGAAAVSLSFILGVIVATVAGGNIREALAIARAEAREKEAAYINLRDATATAISVTADAKQLAKGLAASSVEQKEAAEEAATAISEVTAQSTELSAAASQIATSARHIRDVGDQTRDMAAEAKGRLDGDREQLNQAVRAGEQLQDAARNVSDKVKQMSQILSLITEVAEETHMLSLNATIEATGTGEAGRRFRVIAAEVGNLANKVNSSTEQVTSIVQNVQRTAQQMLASANQTVDSIRRSQMASSTTGEQITQVAEAADTVAHEGFLIVASTEQQLHSTDLIVDAMQQVTTISHKTAAASEQLASTAAQLNSTVERLSAEQPNEASMPEQNISSPPQSGTGQKPTTRLSASATS